MQELAESVRSYMLDSANPIQTRLSAPGSLSLRLQ